MQRDRSAAASEQAGQQEQPDYPGHRAGRFLCRRLYRRRYQWGYWRREKEPCAVRRFRTDLEHSDPVIRPFENREKLPKGSPQNNIYFWQPSTLDRIV